MVSPNVSYGYQVRAVTDHGLSSPSNSINATLRPAGILDMWAATTNSSVTLGWSYAGSEAVTGYVLDKVDEINSRPGHSASFLDNVTSTITDNSVSFGDSFVYRLFVKDDRTYPDHAYFDFVEVTVGQTNVTGAPTVSSIERFSPPNATTSSQTLVYRVAFSENVTGVDKSDFALSPDSTGNGTAAAASARFAQEKSPALAIPDLATVSDSILVPDSGNATSVSVAIGITHTYIGDLKVDLIAPDGTVRTLHDRTDGSTHNITETYAPDFAGVPITGAWTLRIDDNYDADPGTLNSWSLTIDYDATTTNPVTSVSGSGDTYDVTVLAAQDGTYNLDLVPYGHGIVGTAYNPLVDTVPTGADHTYTVSTPN